MKVMRLLGARGQMRSIQKDDANLERKRAVNNTNTSPSCSESVNRIDQYLIVKLRSYLYFLRVTCNKLKLINHKLVNKVEFLVLVKAPVENY